MGKSILKQVKDLDPVLFSFRVKFYPPDPFRLKEEITRYQIFLQLKRDLLHGRLYCAVGEASMLAAFIIQGILILLPNLSIACVTFKKYRCSVTLYGFFTKFVYSGF